MLALRHTGSSTNASASVITHLLTDQNTTSVVFFVTEKLPLIGFNDKTDGPATNLPLVSALAEYTIPGFGPVWLVFDGLFLTRARPPRASEVDQVLAIACKSGKAHYSPQAVPFTSSLSAAEAANVLQAVVVKFPLESGSLEAYLKLF